MKMEKQFVISSIAFELKKLSFNDQCLGWYFDDKLNIDRTYLHPMLQERFQIKNDIFKEDIALCSAPLWQQVIDWFRENHNKVITTYSNASGYLWETHDAIGGTQREWSEYTGPNDGGCWDDYYQAQENAILKSIELLKLK